MTFSYFLHPPGRYLYPIVGHASESELKDYCDENGNLFSAASELLESTDELAWINPLWINERLTELSVKLKDPPHAPLKFDETDYVIHGRNIRNTLEKRGWQIRNPEGRYRESDQCFAIRIRLR